MYIRYILENTERIRITDDSISQNEQTDTLSYIPGSTIRGIIINKLAQKEGFSDIKTALFSDKVRYLNAYPAVWNGRKYQELIPSVKGFYESKEAKDGKKEIQNVVTTGEVTAGYKRAGTGRYCQINGDTMLYMSPALGSDLRISIGRENEEKNMFRGGYIAPGHRFCGYILIEDEVLKRVICDVLERETLYVGNSRSAGYGACRLVSLEEVKTIPYQEYLPDGDRKESVYLYLASNTVMKDENGEYCGLNLSYLAEQIGVTDVQIERCSTSTVQVRGFNRIWDAKIPSIAMYEMGSVFKLSFKGVLKKEAMEAVCRRGIGVRRNEGFGNILILDGYEKICWKQRLEMPAVLETAAKKLTDEDKKVLKIAAKGYYMECLNDAKTRYLMETDFPGKKLPSSQLGTIRSYAVKLMYQPLEAKKQLQLYLEHAVEKDESSRRHNNRAKRKPVSDYINQLLEKEPDVLLREYLKPTVLEKGNVMGFSIRQLLFEEEKMKFKLQLLTDQIKLVNRKGAEG